MGFFEKIFGKAPKPRGSATGIFKMLNGYVPRFTNWGESIYEAELVRSSINAIATHVSKLSVRIQGSARPGLQNKLKHGPNEWQTWGQFLARLASILYVYNTAFIVPVFDEYGEPSGVFPVLPERCEVVEYNGQPYLRYTFDSGRSAAVELSWCGIMTRMQLRSDLFGESNRALTPTMEVIHINNQGIKESVKNAASYRFWAKLTNFSNPADMTKERKRFSRENFSSEADGGGMLLFPNTYNEIHQIENKPFVIDSNNMQAIKNNVFDYFGVNEDVLQNKAFGDAWNGFYEGCIEAFAIQFSDVMTRMLFTFREQSQGNRVFASSNRLQYMSNADKLAVSNGLLDRGILSINDVREIWNLPPVEGGDRRIIRGEYYDANEKLEVIKDVSEDDSGKT